MLVALVAGTHLWLAAHMRAPVVQADEFGYLYGAHYLALGGPPPATPGYPAAPYFPGYSLVLVPLWWASRHTATVYHGALVVNAALAALAAWLASVLAGRLAPGMSPRLRALVGLVVAAYPSYLLFANLAESENLMVPAYLALCLLARRAFAGRQAAIWAALGLGAGALYAVHPSALAVAVAVALVGAWVARPFSPPLPGAMPRPPFAPSPAHSRPATSSGWALLAGLGAGLVLGLGLARALVAYVTAGGPSDSSGLASGLSREATGSGLANLGLELSGQVLYLVAVTAGLVVLGAVLAGGASWAVARHREGRGGGEPGGGDAGRGAVGSGHPGAAARYQTLALVAVTSVVMLVVSVVSVGRPSRIDTILYGRYNEAVLAPLLVAGLVVAVGLRRRVRRPRPVWVVAGGLGVLAVTALGVAAGRAPVLRGTVQASNVLAAHVTFGGSARKVSLDVAALAGLGAATLVAGVVVWRRSLVLGAVVVVAAFAPSAATALGDLAHQSQGTARQQVVPDTLVALRARWGAASGCVGYDVAGRPDPFSFFNDRLFDPAQRFAPFDSATGGRPCSDEVVSDRADLAATLAGAREVVPEDSVAAALWVLPGPLQDRLARAGWLFPPGGATPLPAAGRRAGVALAPGQAGSVAVAPGGSVVVRVSVTHLPGGAGDAPWPAVDGLHHRALAVRVVGSWVPAGAPSPAASPAGSGGPVVARSLGNLPRTLMPGQEAMVDLTLVAGGLRGGRPLAAGAYRVRIGLVQVGAGPFPPAPSSTAPSSTVTVLVSVR